MKKEITQLEGLVCQFTKIQGGKITTLDIILNKERKLKCQSVKMNYFEAITSSLIGKFDVLGEFVIGDICQLSMLESIIVCISRLKFLAEKSTSITLSSY